MCTCATSSRVYVFNCDRDRPLSQPPLKWISRTGDHEQCSRHGASNLANALIAKASVEEPVACTGHSGGRAMRDHMAELETTNGHASIYLRSYTLMVLFATCAWALTLTLGSFTECKPRFPRHSDECCALLCFAVRAIDGGRKVCSERASEKEKKVARQR